MIADLLIVLSNILGCVTRTPECKKTMAARWVPEFTQRFGLDLADSFARQLETLPNFFERLLAAVHKAEAHFDYVLLAWSHGLEHSCSLFADLLADQVIQRRERTVVDARSEERRVGKECRSRWS